MVQVPEYTAVSSFSEVKRKSGMFKMIALGCVVSVLATAASASGEHTYWPGFTGRVTRVMYPVSSDLPKDRTISMTVVLASKPRAKPVIYDNALHAVCQRHQADLLKASKTMSLHSDWRVKVTFQSPSTSAKGISIAHIRSKQMWIANCRSAEQ